MIIHDLDNIRPKSPDFRDKPYVGKNIYRIYNERGECRIGPDFPKFDSARIETRICIAWYNNADIVVF